MASIATVSPSAIKEPSSAVRMTILAAALIMCLAILNRYLILNGFSTLSGDRFDAVINAVILEHWSAVFRGAAKWSEVNYFFPYKSTIAQTDSYFLVGIFYAPFRWIGFDPFISAAFAGTALKAVGFLGMYLVSRRVPGLSFYWATTAAVLFTLSNGMTSHDSRLQLASVAFIPLMALLVWNAISAFFAKEVAKFILAGISAGVLFGAWCMTSFYIAWSWVFFFSFLLAVMLVKNSRQGLRVLTKRIAEHATAVALVLISALASMVPFASVYLPKSYESGVRAWESVRANTVPLEDILQVGSGNLLFGQFYNATLSYIFPHYSAVGEYSSTGFSPVLFALFALGCLRLLMARTDSPIIFTVQSGIIATLITWVFVLNISGYSLWFFVYHLFPGAKALNVVAVYQLFLAFPVVLVAVDFLSSRHWPWPLALAVGTLLVAEEFNRPYIHLDRQAEMDRISLPQAPPKECQSFYVSGWRDQGSIAGNSEWTNNTYPHNVTAMMIAQFAGIPTLNGYASMVPPDWVFNAPNKPDYDARVLAFSKRHHIHGLCRLELDSKSWTLAQPPTPAGPLAPNVVDFRQSDWPGVVTDVQGLSEAEPWGTWSTSNMLSIEFSAPLPEIFSAHIVAQAFGPNVGKDFVARVGNTAVPFTLDASAEERVLQFRNPMRSRTLQIDIPSPTSPEALGSNGDERRLGIGLVQLRIEPR